MNKTNNPKLTDNAKVLRKNITCNSKSSKVDKFLSSLDIKVLRYSNLDVNRNLEGVCQDIMNNSDTSSVTS